MPRNVRHLVAGHKIFPTATVNLTALKRRLALPQPASPFIDCQGDLGDQNAVWRESLHSTVLRQQIIF